eukprot:GHVN01014530.1.p2 GENE.GHVN01014530.1~~GHVN01014530.1.p2  ORF type:complete len:120 (+),score=10.02 GHVN01014530.1:1170-1529(+)
MQLREKEMPDQAILRSSPRVDQASQFRPFSSLTGLSSVRCLTFYWLGSSNSAQEPRDSRALVFPRLSDLLSSPHHSLPLLPSQISPYRPSCFSLRLSLLTHSLEKEKHIKLQRLMQQKG